MGEVVVSCEDGIEVIMDKEEKGNEEKKENKEGSSSMVKWERFLPRMALRVLLVEADDSTRQIIGALLRKCSYKVASVPDGLKAWEVLKARPHNIDLILTEVELPSISGYALLTLIMEHEICKNIPVIMMSKYDTVSTVYKCMLRGAADFLVKPVRINELKNLWQHVWRRHSMNREGSGRQDESVGQQKLEATDENIATSDHSSSSKTCALRQEECIKKGSDAQSSCGKPDLVVQSAYVADIEDQSLPKQVKSPASGLNVQESTNIANSGQNLSTAAGAIAGSDPAAYNDNNTPDLCGGMEQQGCGENVNLCTEAINSRDALGNSSREAIDLIGAFNNHSRCNSCPNDGANKFEAPPHLDLSLRRLCSGVVENKSIYEKQMLNHSNASAFTRYINKTPHTSNSNATSSSIPKEDKINSGDHFLENAPGSSTKAKEPKFPYDRKVISLPVNLSKEVENEYQSASQRLFPIPFPVRGIRVDVCSNPAGYGSKTPPIVCTPSPSASPNPANHHLNFFHQHNVDVANARHQYHPLDQSPRVSSNQPISQQDPKLDSLDDRAHLSPATDQSASSTLCNGTAGLPNGFGCATVGGNGQDAMVPGGSEIGNEQNHVTCDLIRQRSIQREAALTKFRLKRKERCYEKKVRYESRKKLAEQRPRVKGQFVRQVPPDPPPKPDNSGGISVGN